MIALAGSAQAADAVRSALLRAGSPATWTYRMRISEVGE